MSRYLIVAAVSFAALQCRRRFQRAARSKPTPARLSRLRRHPRPPPRPVKRPMMDRAASAAAGVSPSGGAGGEGATTARAAGRPSRLRRPHLRRYRKRNRPAAAPPPAAKSDDNGRGERRGGRGRDRGGDGTAAGARSAASATTGTTSGTGGAASGRSAAARRPAQAGRWRRAPPADAARDEAADRRCAKLSRRHRPRRPLCRKRNLRRSPSRATAQPPRANAATRSAEQGQGSRRASRR